MALNVGPGTDNTVHCLARNNDNSKTINTGNDMVNACNNQNNYADMAACAEGGAHAWGHNGIGAVMQDVYASPGDVIFWLHHAFIDRNFRIWQNRDSARVNTINGNGAGGAPLTLDTTVNVYGMRPDVQIRDILDTMSDKLCYRYNY
jgi:tyrosinase